MASGKTAATLLGLFPPAWRARYGEEFLATAEDQALGTRQVFDIVMVAIDAWLSADVRNATRAFRVATPTPGGGTQMLRTMFACRRTNPGVTPRDGLIGAGVMIASAALFSFIGIAARRNGWPVMGEILKDLAFMGPFTLSMPWWLMKGQPWKAQVVIVGGTFAILAAAAWLATRI